MLISEEKKTLFSKSKAQSIVDKLNAEDCNDGWEYQLVEGYNGPGKAEIGQYYIRIVDYTDGGYIVGYF